LKYCENFKLYSYNFFNVEASYKNLYLMEILSKKAKTVYFKQKKSYKIEKLKYQPNNQSVTEHLVINFVDSLGILLELSNIFKNIKILDLYEN